MKNIQKILVISLLTAFLLAGCGEEVLSEDRSSRRQDGETETITDTTSEVSEEVSDDIEDYASETEEESAEEENDNIIYNTSKNYEDYIQSDFFDIDGYVNAFGFRINNGGSEYSEERVNMEMYNLFYYGAITSGKMQIWQYFAYEKGEFKGSKIIMTDVYSEERPHTREFHTGLVPAEGIIYKTGYPGMVYSLEGLKRLELSLNAMDGYTDYDSFECPYCPNGVCIAHKDANGNYEFFEQ